MSTPSPTHRPPAYSISDAPTGTKEAEVLHRMGPGAELSPIPLDGSSAEPAGAGVEVAHAVRAAADARRGARRSSYAPKIEGDDLIAQPTVVVLPSSADDVARPEPLPHRIVAAEAVITCPSGQRFSFETINVSPRGFFVSADTRAVPLQLGATYPVELRTPKHRAYLRAELVHVGDGRTGLVGFGFRITLIERAQQRALETLIEQAPSRRNRGLVRVAGWRVVSVVAGISLLAAVAVVLVSIFETARTAVDVAAAREATIDEVLSSANGEIVARQSAVLRSPLSTAVSFDVLVGPGAAVKTGDVIARANDPVVDGSRIAAEARFSSAEARLRDLRASGAEASRIAEATELTHRARGELTLKTSESKNRQILAPFEGVVVDVMAHIGDLVPGSGPVAEMVDASQLHADVPFGEGDAARISIGMPARVVLPGIGEVTGTVDGMGIVVRSYGDGRGKAVLVRIALPSDVHTRPGSTARADVSLPERTALMIPSSAVVHESHRTYVWIVVGGRSGTLDARDVELGSKVGASVEVVSGLSPGAVVVREGELPGLRRGILVKVQ